MQPKHIAIIMDGNGRWARDRGLPRMEGHKVGAEVVRRVINYASSLGIEQLTLYCLSSENWKRPQEELDFLLELFVEHLRSSTPLMLENNLRPCFIGRTVGLSENVLNQMRVCEQTCSGNTGMKVCFAINYGSRAEIVDAVRSIVQESLQNGVEMEQIDSLVDESYVAKHLSTAGMSDPDLLIRTAGEMRLSNFLLWQLSYAEIWVTPTYWPDFSPERLDEAIDAFSKRKRRFGGL